jgi:hypothetical protein
MFKQIILFLKRGREKITSVQYMTTFEGTIKPTREEQEQGDLNHITSLSVLPLKRATWVARYISKACLVRSTILRNLKNAKKPKIS